jgi:DNA-binding transcriptional regulator YhcF (GntR family)
MYCEDRKTFQCHPSYATIGEATGMSKNTVKKYVESLERKGFIYTEPTKVKTRDGRTHNGSLLYTLRPIKPIEEAYFEKKIAIANAQYQARLALEKFEKKHGRS